MKKNTLIFFLMLVFGVAVSQNSGEHILLVKALRDFTQDRSKISRIFGNALRSSIESTHEFVLFDKITEKEAAKKLDSSFPGATVREISKEEYKKLKTDVPDRKEIKKDKN